MKEECSMGNLTVLVLILTSLGHMRFPPSLVINTFVTLNRGPGYNFTTFYLMIHCGDGGVCVSISSCCEFNSLHDSVGFYLNLPQMTWR